MITSDAPILGMRQGAGQSPLGEAGVEAVVECVPEVAGHHPGPLLVMSHAVQQLDSESPVCLSAWSSLLFWAGNRTAMVLGDTEVPTHSPPFLLSLPL